MNSPKAYRRVEEILKGLREYLKSQGMTWTHSVKHRKLSPQAILNRLEKRGLQGVINSLETGGTPEAVETVVSMVLKSGTPEPLVKSATEVVGDLGSISLGKGEVGGPPPEPFPELKLAEPGAPVGPREEGLHLRGIKEGWKPIEGGEAGPEAAGPRLGEVVKANVGGGGSNVRLEPTPSERALASEEARKAAIRRLRGKPLPATDPMVRLGRLAKAWELGNHPERGAKEVMGEIMEAELRDLGLEEEVIGPLSRDGWQVLKRSKPPRDLLLTLSKGERKGVEEVWRLYHQVTGKKGMSGHARALKKMLVGRLRGQVEPSVLRKVEAIPAEKLLEIGPVDTMRALDAMKDPGVIAWLKRQMGKKVSKGLDPELMARLEEAAASEEAPGFLSRLMSPSSRAARAAARSATEAVGESGSVIGRTLGKAMGGAGVMAGFLGWDAYRLWKAMRGESGRQKMVERARQIAFGAPGEVLGSDVGYLRGMVEQSEMLAKRQQALGRNTRMRQALLESLKTFGMEKPPAPTGQIVIGGGLPGPKGPSARTDAQAQLLLDELLKRMG